VTVMGTTVACSHIGGDLIDVFAHDDKTTAVLIDVSGHGAGAALTAAAVVSDLRGLLRNHRLAEAFAILNRAMTTSRNRLYACIGVVQLGGNQASIINAGLPPITLLRAGRSIAQFQASGIPPGLMLESSYDTETVTIEPDDRFVMMSDGLTEPFGVADDVMPCLRALDLLVPKGVRTSQHFAEEIRAVWRNRPLVDDATLLIVDRGF